MITLQQQGRRRRAVRPHAKQIDEGTPIGNRSPDGSEIPANSTIPPNNSQSRTRGQRAPIRWPRFFGPGLRRCWRTLRSWKARPSSSSSWPSRKADWKRKHTPTRPDGVGPGADPAARIHGLAALRWTDKLVQQAAGGPAGTAFGSPAQASWIAVIALDDPGGQLIARCITR